jgi:hypothetical protein
VSRVLVTGLAGFVGAALVAALLESGHEVRVLDTLAADVHPRGWPEHLGRARGETRGESGRTCPTCRHVVASPQRACDVLGLTAFVLPREVWQPSAPPRCAATTRRSNRPGPGAGSANADRRPRSAQGRTEVVVDPVQGVTARAVALERQHPGDVQQQRAEPAVLSPKTRNTSDWVTGDPPSTRRPDR